MFGKINFHGKTQQTNTNKNNLTNKITNDQRGYNKDDKTIQKQKIKNISGDKNNFNPNLDNTNANPFKSSKKSPEVQGSKNSKNLVKNDQDQKNVNLSLYRQIIKMIKPKQRGSKRT